MATRSDTLVRAPGSVTDRDRDTAEAQAPEAPASVDAAEWTGVRTVRKGFRWVEAWGIWVPDATQDVVEPAPLEPLGMGPLLPEKHRCNLLDCVECWNTGVRYADYRKAKRLQEL